MASASDEHLQGTWICPIWIAPEWILEQVTEQRLDPDEWVSSCADAGVSGMLLVTKQHDGRCIWPTASESLRMPADLLARFCDAGKQGGVGVVAYYSAGVDDYQVARNPTWAVIDRAGKPCRDIGYAWVCMNSPYRALMMDQLVELLRYEIQGLWLDIFSFGALHRQCFCVWCRERFGLETDGDLLLDDPEHARRREEWRANCLRDLMGQIKQLRNDTRPSASITFNGAGGGPRRHPYLHEAALPLLADVDYLSDEGHDPRFESAASKSLRSFGRPFEMLTSGAVGNEWVGWVTKSPALLCLESAVVGSHGGAFGVGVSVMPDGRLPNEQMALLREVAAFRSEREALFVAQQGVPDVAVYVKPYGLLGDGWASKRPEALPKVERSAISIPDLEPDGLPVNGVWDALREHHISFDLVQSLDGLQSQVLFLQSFLSLTPAEIEAVGRYVHAGGTVIVEGVSSLFDQDRGQRQNFALADVLGIGFVGYSGVWDGSYLLVDDDKLTTGMPSYPLAVEGPGIVVRPQGAIVLGRAVPPMGGDSSVDRHSAARMNPPSLAPTGPAITMNRFGAGRALYIAFELGEHISRQRHVDPWAKQLLANIVQLGIAEPLLRTNAPAGVEIVLNRTDRGDALVHLINHYVANEYSSSRAPTLGEFTVWLNQSRMPNVARVLLEPGHLQADVDVDAGWLAVHIPNLAIHRTILVECDL